MFIELWIAISRHPGVRSIDESASRTGPPRKRGLLPISVFLLLWTDSPWERSLFAEKARFASRSC